MKKIFDDELEPRASDLLFFIDDTGNENFAGNQHFYGLGGCAVLGAGHGHLRDKWREVRRAVNGDPDAALHASELAGTPENFATLSDFFLDPSFVRIAATTTKAIELPALMHPCVPLLGQLKEEIEVVAGLVECKTVWIIIESSERADQIIQACFSQLKPLRGSKEIDVEKCLMRKSSRETGLEVADFVISAAGSQIQRRLRGQAGWAPDFHDVFGQLDPLGCRYREVSHVTVEENGVVKVSGVALTKEAAGPAVTA
jgi:hypothetical protein